MREASAHTGIHIRPAAWLLWFLAAGAIPLTSRHPFYLALILLVVIFVHLAVPDRGGGNPWRLFAYVGSSVAVLSIGFNVLTVHTGDQVFAEIPEALPIIGGPLTYNALLYGMASALAVSSLLFAAATFNTAVRHAELLRSIPPAFRQIGVAGSIALNYVPQTIRAGRDIYDAQRARGRSMRSIGDGRAFLVPLLGNGLERASQMSEAMEVRGFGRQSASTSSSRLYRLRVPAAGALLIVALPLIATGRLEIALPVAAGAIMIVSGFRPSRSLSSRLSNWNGSSVAMAITASIAMFVFVFDIVAGTALEYTPFPRLAWPEFELAIGLAISLLLTPAIVIPGGGQ